MTIIGLPEGFSPIEGFRGIRHPLDPGLYSDLISGRDQPVVQGAAQDLGRNELSTYYRLYSDAFHSRIEVINVTALAALATTAPTIQIGQGVFFVVKKIDRAVVAGLSPQFTIQLRELENGRALHTAASLDNATCGTSGNSYILAEPWIVTATCVATITNTSAALVLTASITLGGVEVHPERVFDLLHWLKNRKIK